MVAQTQIVKTQPYALSTWGADEALIRETYARGTTDAEFRLFAKLAERFDLDPYAKQIWCVKYGSNPAAIYASRDGFLAIAHRSGQFDGMETRAIYEDGVLTRAVCTIWRKDMTHPISVDVPLAEYVSDKNPLWKSKPETMLKKVAESHALRRAFNVSGLYTPEEMDQARNDQPQYDRYQTASHDALPTPADVATEPQLKLMFGIAKNNLNWSDADIDTEVANRYNNRVPEGLSKREASEFIDWLKQQPPKSRQADDVPANSTTPEGIVY